METNLDFEKLKEKEKQTDLTMVIHWRLEKVMPKVTDLVIRTRKEINLPMAIMMEKQKHWVKEMHWEKGLGFPMQREIEMVKHLH
jgi:hypothetical protein